MLRRPNGRPDGPGDQIGDQNSTVTKITKIRLSIWSPGAIRSSNEAFAFFLEALIIAQKAQLHPESGHQSGHLQRSGLPGGIWSSRNNLVAH